MSDLAHPVKTVDELTQKNVQTIALMEKASQKNRTLGDRVADAFAGFVGSWTFIIGQSLILIAWIIINNVRGVKHWDPYPFILLNLALSFQAAYASPIIMMSQNRQSRLDERRNHLDLQINLLAEQEATEVLRLLRLLCLNANIPIQDEADLEALGQPTELNVVVNQIEKTVEKQVCEDVQEESSSQ
jgi:uncharacterized membrane protein